MERGKGEGVGVRGNEARKMGEGDRRKREGGMRK